ncbi:hypothetical protein PIB30_056784, partial [Stylosanthes scabra]|nr:hypothetical protein [Stylosanthes scabra]
CPVLAFLLRIEIVDALSSTGSDLSWVVEAWGVTQTYIGDEPHSNHGQGTQDP